MRRKALLIIFLIFLCAILSLSYASAQAGRGKARVNGVVLDEQGNPIVSAAIVIDLLGRETSRRETTTNQKGEWTSIGLGSGNWRVTASAEGYAPATTDISVSQIEVNKKVVLTLKKIPKIEAAALKDDASLALIEQANQLFLERKYEEALVLLQQFLEKNPEAYQTHINIGDCYKEKGEYEKALEEYNLALEKAKTDAKFGKEMTAKSMAGIGDVYLKKGDFENAQDYFTRSIELLPDNEILAYNVGEIYFSNQKLDEAIRYFSIAGKIKPDWSLPYYKLGLVHLNKTDYEPAKENLKKFLELDPNSEQAGTVKNLLEYLEKIKK